MTTKTIKIWYKSLLHIKEVIGNCRWVIKTKSASVIYCNKRELRVSITDTLLSED